MFDEGATKLEVGPYKYQNYSKRCDDSLIAVSERALAEGLGVGRMGNVPLPVLTLKSGGLHENEQFTKDIRQPSRP